MNDSSFRAALLSKDKKAYQQAYSENLSGVDLVQFLNDLLFCSVSVDQISVKDLHPVCVINSIKNIIGDDRDNPSKSLLKFASNYLAGFEFRKNDQLLLDEAVRDGIGLVAFLGDLEDACQAGNWAEVQGLTAKTFMASDCSRGTLDALAEIGLQDSDRNVVFIFHLLRAFQFKEAKDDNWAFTKSILDWLNENLLPEPHDKTEKSPSDIIDVMVESLNPTLFTSVLRLWDGDYVRLRGFQRELSHWCSHVIKTESDIYSIQSHCLESNDPKKFINSAESIVDSNKSQSEMADQLVMLESIRALSKIVSQEQLEILGARLNQKLS